MNWRGLLPPSHPLRAVVRLGRDSLSYRLLRATRGEPDRVLSFGFGGIGDDLMCSTVAREWKRRGARNIWVLAQHGSLFRGNPDITGVLAYNEQLLTSLRSCGHDVKLLRYQTHLDSEDRDEAPREHLLAALARAAGLEGEVTLRPYLHLTEQERRGGRLATRQIVIQSSGRSARFCMRTKEWFPERFAEVTRALRAKATVIQVGSSQDPALPAAIDLRGRTSLRETAAILHNSDLFVGLVGGMMHLARSVDCRAAIVYGGRERPEQSGYSANENLTLQSPCSPCWSWNRCDHEMACMTGISAEAVVAACERALRRTGEPLQAEVLTL